MLIMNKWKLNWVNCGCATIKIRGVSNEPDCSPHPFDILAIWALYQTVDR